MTLPSSSGYRKYVLLGLAVAIIILLHSRAQAQRELRVAAAADLQPVMPTLAAAYGKKTGVRVIVSFGSSSTLATQIIQGAPFDVFLGADFASPEKIVAAEMANEKLPLPYAKGTLVLWARKEFPGPLSPDLLVDPRVSRVAIADEFHAPYGRAAYAALRALKLYDPVRAKLVVGENVAQTAQFIQTGNAQIGFISLTLASSPLFRKDGQYVRVPKVYPEIQQTGVTMKKSANAQGAKDFLDWMRSPEVQNHLEDFGLEPVR